jgi:hypothetical protein
MERLERRTVMRELSLYKMTSLLTESLDHRETLDHQETQDHREHRVNKDHQDHRGREGDRGNNGRTYLKQEVLGTFPCNQQE